MNECVKRNFGECEIVILFKGYNADLKENVLSILTASYQARIEEMKKLQKHGGEDEKDS